MNPEQYSRFTHAASALVTQHDRLSSQAGAVARQVASKRLTALLKPWHLLASLVALSIAITLLCLPLYAPHLFAPAQMYHSVKASIEAVEEHRTMLMDLEVWEPARHTSCNYSLSYKVDDRFQASPLTEEKVRRFTYASCQRMGSEVTIWLKDGEPYNPHWEPPGLPWGTYLTVVLVGAVMLTIATRLTVAWLGVRFRVAKYSREARHIIREQGYPAYLNVVIETADRNFTKFAEHKKHKEPTVRRSRGGTGLSL